MHRPIIPKSIGSALISALTLVAASCSTDATGPDGGSPVVVGGFGQINGNRVHRAANGVVFTLDHREGTLTATGGKKVRLKPDVFTRLEKDFDLMQAVDVRPEHFKAQKDFAQVRQLEQMRNHAIYRVEPGSSAASSQVPPRM